MQRGSAQFALSLTRCPQALSHQLLIPLRLFLLARLAASNHPFRTSLRQQFQIFLVNNMDSIRFYKDHGVYNQFGGVVLASEEGERIADALGMLMCLIPSDRAGRH